MAWCSLSSTALWAALTCEERSRWRKEQKQGERHVCLHSLFYFYLLFTLKSSTPWSVPSSPGTGRTSSKASVGEASWGAHCSLSWRPACPLCFQDLCESSHTRAWSGSLTTQEPDQDATGLGGCGPPAPSVWAASLVWLCLWASSYMLGSSRPVAFCQ